MESFAESMEEYQKQLEKGAIQEAYQGLMKYFRDLRTHFIKTHPEYPASSSIYYGYMDMTYFSLLPASIKRRNLKIAIVFVHEAFRFEVWLSGSNRNVQKEYWKRIKEGDWNLYSLATDPAREDYVLNSILVEHPNFSNLHTLSKQIEQGTIKFIRNVEGFLSTEAS